MSQNRILEAFVAQKKLTPRKIRNLLVVHDTANRLSLGDYMPKSEIDGLVNHFGVEPDVTTWGNFFLSELAADHWEKSDAEFEKICQTVLFDLIAATLIFTGKDTAFIESSVADYERALSTPVENRTDEDLEKIHLGILAGYFTQMRLNKRLLTEEDFAYFDQFSTLQRAG